jgi:hypothetical protein
MVRIRRRPKVGPDRKKGQIKTDRRVRFNLYAMASAPFRTSQNYTPVDVPEPTGRMWEFRNAGETFLNCASRKSLRQKKAQPCLAGLRYAPSSLSTYASVTEL